VEAENMAKYDITYSCGHSGTVNIIGPHRSRESRIAYLESGECFDCFKQHSTVVAHEQAQALELPALTGTEKQIAWSETLRLAKLNEIESAVERLDRDKCNFRQILVTVEHISNETSAKQWIEWRNDDPLYLLSKVYKAFLSAPTKEQRGTEREAQEKADAIQRAVLVEATIRPETSVCEQAVEITLSGKTISAFLPERRDDFKEIVRSLGYAWKNGCWQRTIDTFAGLPADRLVELGHTLLSRGYPVRVFDDVLRARIVSGAFEPEQTRWITKRVSGAYAGCFAIQWSRNEDCYAAARKIKSSKYDAPHVIVPAVQFAQVLDFAERYDFRLSTSAKDLARQAQEDKEKMLVVAKVPVPTREEIPPVGDVPPVLPVPELVIVADDLRDEA
jgi:hypothetical protein